MLRMFDILVYERNATCRSFARAASLIIVVFKDGRMTHDVCKVILYEHCGGFRVIEAISPLSTC